MKNRIESRIGKIIENVDCLDKRAYFTVNTEGDIKRKKINFTIPAMAFCEDDTLFNQVVEKEVNEVEKVKEKDIERLPNVEDEKLKENFMKLVINGDLEFSKKYGKELALRNQEEFIKTLFNLSLMDNIYLNKPIMALALKEVLDNVGWVDEVGYLVISYFTKQRYDLNSFETAQEMEEMRSKLPRILPIVAYAKVLNTYEYKNAKKYRYVLNEAVKNISGYVESGIERIILKYLEKH